MPKGLSAENPKGTGRETAMIGSARAKAATHVHIEGRGNSPRAREQAPRPRHTNGGTT